MSKPHDEFKNPESNALYDRFECLKAMNTLIKHANDETVYESWIWIIPDQCEDDELLDVAMDQPDTYAEACGLFLRLMKGKAMREGGLYIGDEVYDEDD